jgi:hypothetical protein
LSFLDKCGLALELSLLSSCEHELGVNAIGIALTLVEERDSSSNLIPGGRTLDCYVLAHKGSLQD